MPSSVLLLTYEFPPSGGAGVQRVTKFARYLPDRGWDPVVVCAEPVRGRPFDETLLAEVAAANVTRLPARHVGTAVARALRPFKRVRAGAAATGGGDGAAARLGHPLSARISAWIALPDNAVLWARAAVPAAVRAGGARGVRAVVASGPPHSVLVAGARTAAVLGVPFVADMRDAWRDNPGTALPTAWHRSRVMRLEREALGAAAVVLCVSEPIASEAREMGARDARVLPNGFDPDDLPPWTPDPMGPLTLAYMGRFYGSHDPRHLFAGMAAAVSGGGPVADLRLEFVGPEPGRVAAQAAAAGLSGRVHCHGYLPHRRALETVARADVGVVVITEEPGAAANLTGKLFEYLGMGLPVLVVGPADGAAARLVRETGAGWVAQDGDVAAIAETLAAIAAGKAHGVRSPVADASVVARFNRRSQAGELAEVLDHVTRGTR